MNLEDIMREIDAGGDANNIRAHLAIKIEECLVERGHELGKRERTHFGLAIDLLHTPWLRLIWTHVDSVCNQRTRELPTAAFEVFGDVPELPELKAKLERAIAEIKDHRATDPD